MPDTKNEGPRNRLPLDDNKLRELVTRITNGETEQANALLLLLDEFEASQFDRLRIDSMCLTLSKAAFAITGDSDRAQHTHVDKLRKAANGG